MPRASTKFNGFIGQARAVELLKGQIQGAVSLGEPFPHTIFHGPSGVGKTELASAVATEFNTSVIYLMGNRSPSVFADHLSRLNRFDFLFIDEAHNLKPAAQELLFQAIDNLQVPIIGADSSGNASNDEQELFDIKPSTIVLATDQPGRLSNALHKRIAVNIALHYYPETELKEIVDRLATDLDILISPQAARLIAQVSGGLPRKAKHHLQNLRRQIPGAEKRQIGVPQVARFLREFGVDQKGLAEQEKTYLSHLQDAGSASLESLAFCLGLDTRFVRSQIEPLLIQQHRLVVIGPGGRRLTLAGKQWIEQHNSNPVMENNHDE